MTAPTSLFGGGGDGSLRMEDWLAEMCPGCVHYTAEGTPDGDYSPGFPCDLPTYAYMDPYEDRPAWSADASPSGPFGITCMQRVGRPGCANCGRTYRGNLTPACRCTSKPCDGQLSLTVTT